MTGIERLRAIAGVWDEWGLGGTFAEIADQIERERDAEVADSPYDAILPEDRDALAWVRDHGGLDHVRAEWRSRVPYDRYQRKRQRLLGHIAECETALGRRNRLVKELEARVKDLTNENAELRRRAMPEGMEWLLEVWPRWSNGEYCRFGDWWTADRYGYYEPMQLRRLVIYTPEFLDELEQGDGESYGYVWDFMRPSELDYRPDKVEPPAPAVLAADGEPIEVGQTVWHVDTGDEFHVSCFSDGTVNVSDKKGGGLQLLPSQLTHQRPVLDADGVPIELGDDLYSVEGGLKLHVSNIDRVSCRIATSAMFALDKWADPSMFTHTKPEPPDSWKRIEEDARGLDSGVDIDIFSHTHEDIVRRCRALAERERGE